MLINKVDTGYGYHSHDTVIPILLAAYSSAPREVEPLQRIGPSYPACLSVMNLKFKLDQLTGKTQALLLDLTFNSLQVQ